jgi:hypothetical protein
MGIRDSHTEYDTGIKLVIPPQWRAKLIPCSEFPQVRIFSPPGVMDESFSSTLELTLQNDSHSEVRMTAGTFLVTALILPTIHPTLNFDNGTSRYSQVADGVQDEKSATSTKVDDNSSSLQKKDEKELDKKELGSSELTKFYSSLGTLDSTHKVELISLHVMMDDEFPQCINLPEINSAIFLPTSLECRKSIEAELNSSGKQMLQNDVKM